MPELDDNSYYDDVVSRYTREIGERSAPPPAPRQPSRAETDLEDFGPQDASPESIPGRLSGWWQKYSERVREERSRLKGKTDFEVVAGKSYPEFAKEHAVLASVLGTARNTFTGSAVRRAAGLPAQPPEDVTAAEQEAEKSLSPAGRFGVHFGAGAYDLPAFAGLTAAQAPFLGPGALPAAGAEMAAGETMLKGGTAKEAVHAALPGAITALPLVAAPYIKAGRVVQGMFQGGAAAGLTKAMGGTNEQAAESAGTMGIFGAAMRPRPRLGTAERPEVLPPERALPPSRDIGELPPGPARRALPPARGVGPEGPGQFTRRPMTRADAARAEFEQDPRPFFEEAGIIPRRAKPPENLVEGLRGMERRVPRGKRVPPAPEEGPIVGFGGTEDAKRARYGLPPKRTVHLYRGVTAAEYAEFQRTGVVRRGPAIRVTENRAQAERYAGQRGPGARVIEFDADIDSLSPADLHGEPVYRVAQDIHTRTPTSLKGGTPAPLPKNIPEGKAWIRMKPEAMSGFKSTKGLDRDLLPKGRGILVSRDRAELGEMGGNEEVVFGPEVGRKAESAPAPGMAGPEKVQQGPSLKAVAAPEGFERTPEGVVQETVPKARAAADPLKSKFAKMSDQEFHDYWNAREEKASTKGALAYLMHEGAHRKAQETRKEAQARASIDETTRENLNQVIGQQKKAGEKGAITIEMKRPEGAEPKYSPEVKGVLTATRKHITTRVFDKTKRAVRAAFIPYEKLAGRPEFADYREWLFQGRSGRTRANREAQEDLTGIIGGLSDTEVRHHGDYVKLKNLEWRKENVPDDPKMPRGLSLDQIKDAISKLKPIVKANPKLSDSKTGSLARHVRAVEAAFNEKVEMGQIKPNTPRNPWYYHHEVLDFQRGRGLSGLRNILFPKKLASAKRYMGSERDIDADYPNVMFRDFFTMREAKIKNALLEKILVKANRPEEYGKPAKDPAMEIIPVDRRDIFQTPRVADMPDALRDAIDKGTITDPVMLKRWRVELAEIEKIRAGKTGKSTVYIPRGLAETLTNDYDMGRMNTPGIIQLANDGVHLIKGIWVNVRPIIFGTTNMIGDTQWTAINQPSAFRMVPKAIETIIGTHRGTLKGKDFDNYRLGLEKGVVDSGLTARETTEVRELPQFSHLKRLRSEEAVTKAANEYAQRMQEATEAGRDLKRASRHAGRKLYGALRGVQVDRENILRLASWLDNLDRVKHGKEPINVWSNFKEMEGITDPLDRAAKASREMLFNYGGLTPFEETYARDLMVPFYTFSRNNIPRWARLPFRSNSWVREGATPTARAGRFVASKAYVAAVLSAASSAVVAWNLTQKKEVEDKLSSFRKGIFHINVGLDKNGEPLTFQASTPLDEFFRASGLDGVTPDIDAMMRGRKSLNAVWEKWYRNSKLAGVPIVGYAYDTMVEKMGPIQKLSDALKGISTYPEPRRPRAIPPSGRRREAAKAIGAGEFYRLFDTATGRRGNVGMRDYLREYFTLVRRPDYRREAYMSAKENIRDFLDKKGYSPSLGGGEGPFSGAYKRLDYGLGAGDRKEITEAVKELATIAAKTGKPLRASLRAHMKAKQPLREVPKHLRREYINSLTPDEKKQLGRAYEYYYATMSGRREEPARAAGGTR